MQDAGSPQPSTFGELLKFHRLRALLSQQQLAVRAGLSDRAIRNLETSRVRAPNVSTARLLAEALSLSGSDLDEFTDAAVGDRAPDREEPPDPVRPAQLPMATRHFVGRKAEIAVLDDAVTRLHQTTSTTVVVLCGGAGVGKTTLAVNWSHRVSKHFPDGRLFVDLGQYAGLTETTALATVVRGFLDAFGVAPKVRPDTVEAQVALYHSVVAERRLLLVIDNALDAKRVRPLLPASPGCIAVVISRAPLHSLVVREGAELIRVGLLDAQEALDLLAARLGRSRVRAEPAAATDIVRACGRLPLALAVVAARASFHESVPLAAVAAELASAPAMGPSDAGDPAEEFRAVLSWSYQTLDRDAAAAFRATALHPAGVVDRHAVAVLVELPPERARAALNSLERAGLATQEAPGQFTVHDLIRQYAQELSEQLEPATVRTAGLVRLAAHLANQAQEAVAHFDGGGVPGNEIEGLRAAEHASAWFGRELPTLMALASAASAAGDDRTCWNIARDVGRFLRRQDLCAEQLQIQTTALRSAERLADPERLAVTCRYLATTHHALGHREQARTFLDRAIGYALAAGDAAVVGAVHLDAGAIAAVEQEFPRALAHAESAFRAYSDAGDRVGAGRALNAMGWDHLRLRAPQRAIELCERAIAVLSDAGDPAGTAATLDTLGEAHAQLGEREPARSYYEQALVVFGRLGVPVFEAETLMRLGDLHHDDGDTTAARVCWSRALDILDHPALAESPVAADLRRRMSR